MELDPQVSVWNNFRKPQGKSSYSLFITVVGQLKGKQDDEL